jgi:hypothetical protein
MAHNVPARAKPDPVTEEPAMTHDDAAQALLEQVLDGLHRAEGGLPALIDSLGALDGETRALSLVLALLMADEAIGATFRDTAPAQRERELARGAARALTAAADRIEAGAPDRRPVRLAELPLGPRAA